MKALLIIDVQNDFIKGGTLAVPDSEQVIPVINDLMEKFNLILATQDWHPRKTAHFEEWPVHCVAGSKGADFPFDFHKEKIVQIFYKGTGNRDDGYSGFRQPTLNLLIISRKMVFLNYIFVELLWSFVSNHQHWTP